MGLPFLYHHYENTQGDGVVCGVGQPIIPTVIYYHFSVQAIAYCCRESKDKNTASMPQAEPRPAGQATPPSPQVR